MQHKIRTNFPLRIQSGVFWIIPVSILAFLFIGCTEKPASSQITENGLVRVASAKVCMINDKVFRKDQIPVEVDGKTYYGCCEMCETKLRNNLESRFAMDPVSQKRVDKATAVIGADESDKVFYFENEANLKQFEGARVR